MTRPGRRIIDCVTVSQAGFVGYEGTDPPLVGEHRVKFHVTTYRRWGLFDWSTIPASVPVLFLEGADIRTIWRVIMNHDHPSFSAKLAVAKAAGLRVTDVRQIRKEAAR